MILLGIILFLTVLEAVPEGLVLRYRNDKTGEAPVWLPGVIEFVKLFGISLLIPLTIYLVKSGWEIESWAMYFVGWVFLRYTIFSPIHNLCANVNIFYVGSTKLYSRLMQFPDRKWGAMFHGFTRVVLGISGLLFVLQADGSLGAAVVITWIVAGLLTLVVATSFIAMVVNMIKEIFKK